MRNAMISVLAVTMILSLGCAQKPDVSADMEAIQKLHHDFVHAYETKDFEAFLSFIADDAVWMAPNRVPLEGKEAIRAFYNFDVNQSVKADVTLDEVQLFGDWAFRRATWKITVLPAGEDIEVTMVNKSIQVLQRQEDGSWKIARSIWNPNTPAE